MRLVDFGQAGNSEPIEGGDMQGIEWTNLGVGVIGFLFFCGLAVWIGNRQKAANKAKWEKIQAYHAQPKSEELRLATEAFNTIALANAKLPFPNLHAVAEASKKMMKEERKRFAAYTGDERDEAESKYTPQEILDYRIMMNPSWEPSCHKAEKKQIMDMNVNDAQARSK